MVGNLIVLRDAKVLEVSEYIDTAWLKKLAGEC